jgi:hypothetical protein
VDLGDPIGIVAQAIGKLGLIHELGKSLDRRRSLGTLDFGE